MNAIERLPKAAIDSTAAAIKSMTLRLADAAPLYAALGAPVADDPELLAMAAQGLAFLPGAQLFTAVHYLLLRDPRDPLAQYYADLTDTPKPPGEAFPDFVRFCRQHREEILHLVRTRTVQATFVDRCNTIMTLLSHVADRAGEPLDLIEIGCSAGLLLTFDKYAYEPKGQRSLGSKNAPLTLNFEFRGGPALHIPKIGKRIGLDLRPVDAKSKDERLWLLAQLPPEARAWASRLTTALDVVAQTDITFFEGDALDILPDLIAKSPGPLCVYHANCVCYWSPEAKAALDKLLLTASRGREFFRVEMEPEFQKMQRSDSTIELVLGHYRNGTVDRKNIANTTAEGSVVTWLV